MGFTQLAGAQRRLFRIFTDMILVTGGTGLVGGHLLYRFRESEQIINAIYRTTESIDITRRIFDTYNTGDAALVDNINWIHADILDLPSLEQAMEGITQVYHCAAALEADSFEEMKKVNVTGTQHLVDLSIALNIKKFCYVSSISTLGNPIAKKPINEEDFFNPDAKNTDYAISKYGGEMEVWRASQEGLPVIIVNPGVILGEGAYDKGSGKLFQKTNEKQPFYTSGSSGFVDVRDVVAIMQQLMESDIKGERYILIAENVKFKKLLDLIAEKLEVKKPSIKLRKWMLYSAYLILKIPSWLGITKGLSRAQIHSLTSKTTYSNDKINTTLGYEFINLKESIERVALDFKA
ncbi:Nucleoside-diphosphate-sugar epimerase [Nonlabens sp. Hel1_33_55]|uniref:NAD-dependent epimerase/dehydratase family protein n=1 Tax=Nonlabens sp. Hel1_33_55 TaxID=1336802 RepID=UPI000875C802|nr:NAD-dependent epimerase/dehydratase family protein [Nonlabens sp. Hel1_33_55]SCY39897.1 Nucleoside-diphosphate-sugar epimerase [Nonlabens sp. Hel1_33_55]